MSAHDPSPVPAPSAPRRRPSGWLAVSAILAGLLVLTLLPLLLWRARPRLTSEEASALVMTALQRETRQAFVITGALDITVTTRVQNVRKLLPGLLDVNLGTVESSVRAPGRVSYGFPLSELERGAIRVFGDTIELEVPDPRIFSVEPRLEAMEVETSAGWLRVRENTQLEVQQRATQMIGPALRRQAQQHLADSEQPRVNTAETLHELLAPAFAAAGVERAVFRFIINRRLVYTGEPAEARRR